MWNSMACFFTEIFTIMFCIVGVSEVPQWDLRAFLWKRRKFIGAPQTDLYDPWVFTRLPFFSILTWKTAFNAKCTLFYGTVEDRNVCLNVLLWDWNIMMSAKLRIYVHCHSQDMFFKWRQKHLFLLFKMWLEHWWSWALRLCFQICVFSWFSKTFKMFLPTVLL